MSEITSIIVFGCTGNIGLQILQRGTLEDLDVTAYVRTPQKIPPNISKKLHRIIQGDVLDEQRVEEAIEGHDAVISALGSGKILGDSEVMSNGCRNIIKGMKKHDVTRLVVISTAAGLPGGKGLFQRLGIGLGNYTDHVRQLEILREESNSIEWVAMMPPTVKNNPHVNPDYKVERNKVPGAWVVTTGELADFAVKVFMDRTSTECFRHNRLGISSHPKKTSNALKTTFGISLIVLALGLVYYRLLPGLLQDFLDEVTGYGHESEL